MHANHCVSEREKKVNENLWLFHIICVVLSILRILECLHILCDFLFSATELPLFLLSHKSSFRKSIFQALSSIIYVVQWKPNESETHLLRFFQCRRRWCYSLFCSLPAKNVYKVLNKKQLSCHRGCRCIFRGKAWKQWKFNQQPTKWQRYRLINDIRCERLTQSSAERSLYCMALCFVSISRGEKETHEY